MKTLACVLLISLTMATQSRGEDVRQWTPHDFSFQSSTSVTNPFMVPFSATITGPTGRQFTLPGFFDGNGTWKIRVAPTSPGKWSLVTSSEVAELNGQRGEFTCIKNSNTNVHGVLKVDSDHPHHFQFEDGTHFFLQGYEYDWLWALDQDQTTVPTIEKSLDTLAAYGFNYVIVNSYAYDTGWRKGQESADDFGPAKLHAWEGASAAPDHAHMNLKYWQHYDQMMNALAERGIQAHMLMKVYNKQVKWPQRGSEEEQLFFRWLVARYAAYPNIIWDFSKEAHNEKDLQYKQTILTWLRANDPYQHLVTVHDDDQANDSGAYDELNDFRADQQHSNWHTVISQQRARKEWPVVNVEFGYEHGSQGMEDKTYGKVQPPEEMARRAWEIQMAGGYTAYYYTYTAWDVIRPLDVPVGYTYFKHFGDFWRSTHYWELQPSDDLVSEGWCSAQPGSEYVVFLNEPRPFTLDVSGANTKLEAQWFNPLTGEETSAGTLGNGQATLTPPDNWGAAPVVLHATAHADSSTTDAAAFELPANDDGVPGVGPLRRYDWFRDLWRNKRSGWAERANEDQQSLVFLGDSITQGWGDDFGGNFAEVKKANRGISGDTTRGMLIRLQEDVLALHPQGVVLLMGTNDLEEGAEPATIAENFKSILAALMAHNDQMPIVVCQVFPSSAEKKRPADKIKALNALYAAAVKGNRQVTLIDTWTLFADSEGNARPEEFPDLLHPNKLGYGKWSSALRPILATLGFVDTQPEDFEVEAGFESLTNGRDLSGWCQLPSTEKQIAQAKRWKANDPQAPTWPIITEKIDLTGRRQSPDGRYVAIADRLVVTTPPEGRKIQQLWTTREFPNDFTLKLEFRATPNADSGVFLREPQLQCRDYLLAGPYKELKKYRAGEWNELVVRVSGDTAYCTCNGEVLEEAFKVPATGPIGLEGDRGQIEYRRIRVGPASK